MRRVGLVGAFVVAVCAAGGWIWSRGLETEYLARSAPYRAAAAERAPSLGPAVAALARAKEDPDFDAALAWVTMCGFHDDDVEERDRATVPAAWPRLATYFAAVEKAAAGPVHGDEGLMQARSMLELRAVLEPQRWASCVTTLLDLAERGRGNSLYRRAHRITALEILQERLAVPGALAGAPAGRWRASLATVEPLAGLAERWAESRRAWVDFADELRAGRDP